MDNEKKQQFVLRISNANKTEMIVILYDMYLTYSEDAREALKAGDEKAFRQNIVKTRNVLNELMDSLNFEYEEAGFYLSLYIYITKLLVKADIHSEPEKLEEAEKLISRLRDMYKELVKQDTSGPVMKNTQTVYAGITYGKNDINVNVDDGSSSRGFLV